MKKMVIVVILVAAVIGTLIGVTLTGCTRREHNYGYASVDGFTPIEVKEITVKPIEVKTFDTITIQSWD